APRPGRPEALAWADQLAALLLRRRVDLSQLLHGRRRTPRPSGRPDGDVAGIRQRRLDLPDAGGPPVRKHAAAPPDSGACAWPAGAQLADRYEQGERGGEGG